MPFLMALIGNKWTWIALVIGALGLGLKIQTSRLDSAKADLTALRGEYETFKARVVAEGKVAQERANKQALEDKQRKEKADAENQRTVSLLNQRVASLRYDRAHSGTYGVSAPGASPGSPDRSCFKSTEFERAVSGFVEGTAAIVEECDGIRAALDTAKNWAQSSR